MKKQKIILNVVYKLKVKLLDKSSMTIYRTMEWNGMELRWKYHY